MGQHGKLLKSRTNMALPGAACRSSDLAA